MKLEYGQNLFVNEAPRAYAAKHLLRGVVCRLACLILASLLVFSLSPCLPVSSSPLLLLSPSDEEVTVTGEGMAAFSGDVAAAQEEAVWDAKRNAVEQAVGIFLKAKTVGGGFGVEEDEIQGRTQGFVRRWEVIEGSRRIETVPTSTPAAGSAARILHIQVRATVKLMSLARRLSDIADVYKDLERPRIRVSITPAVDGKGKKRAENRADDEADKAATADAANRLQEQIAGELRIQGFDVASEGSAEIVLQGTLDIIPTVRIGDASAPYGVGDMLAACRAHLTLQAVCAASEDVLFVRQTDGAGRSFQSDREAQNEAVTQIAQSVLNDNEAQFIPFLLARWARERQEGHVIVVRADGLTAGQRERLKQALSDMRGFRRFVDEKTDTKTEGKQGAARLTLRFLTRRDARSLRRDLTTLLLAASVAPATLLVLNDRGPVIHCAVRSSAGTGRLH